MKVIEADVLVGGAGGAGLRAAIEARRNKANVILACKTPIGYGSCTAYSAGAYAAAVGGLSPEDHFETTIKTGRLINNQKLVEVLVREAPKELRVLGDLGVRFRTQRGIVFCDGKARMAGLGFTEPLAAVARKTGVRMHQNTVILEVIKVGERVTGALALDFHRGKYIFFKVKSIVLATGGAGALYHRTDNPVHTTGDGYALAYNLGLELQDLEFVQFYPLGTAEPNLPVQMIPQDFGDEGSIINSNGEDIPNKYCITDRPVAGKARDMLSRAMMMEITHGRGINGAVLLDLTKATKETFEASDRGGIILRTFHALQKPIRIAPMCHHFMGGVVTGAKCETAVKGLYAAGEVVGGIHGANRLNGNALSEIFVFGAISGRESSKYAKSVKATEIDQKVLKEKTLEITMAASCDKTLKTVIKPIDLITEIKMLMWEELGILRSADCLKDALDKIMVIREERVPRLSIQNARDLYEFFEATNGLIVAELITRSALHRKESRGAHYRLDYPEQNDRNWLSNTIIAKREGVPAMSSKPVVKTEFLKSD